MKTAQVTLNAKSSPDDAGKVAAIDPNLVFIFGAFEHFSNNGLVSKVCAKFPKALVIGCSTAGEISDKGVTDGTLVITGSHFDSPDFRPSFSTFTNMAQTKDAGIRFAEKFDKKDLKAIFVLGRGLDINGSALIDGIRSVIGKDIPITGGLAGDGARFQRTFTVINGEISDSNIVGFGIYGEAFEIGYGSVGGWEPFGPVRTVTKAKQNVLYELDGEPALAIYKKYLGEKAKDLPGSGLLYPFALLKDNQDSSGIIRTILAVSEEDQSVTLAGDIPEKGLVRLMHASNDKLVRGAQKAAETTLKNLSDFSDDPDALGILISCVGRKLVMGGDVEDELDAVRDVIGSNHVTGFYSYGEICPESGFSECKLHNQTMTITYIKEKKAA